MKKDLMYLIAKFLDEMIEWDEDIEFSLIKDHEGFFVRFGDNADWYDSKRRNSDEIEKMIIDALKQMLKSWIYAKKSVDCKEQKQGLSKGIDLMKNLLNQLK